MTDNRCPAFVTPWRAVDEQEGLALRGRLLFEVTPGHPLWDAEPDVIGRSDANDDIVIVTRGGLYGIAHLVWGTSPGDATWPATMLFQSAEELSAAMREWSRDAGFLDGRGPLWVGSGHRHRTGKRSFSGCAEKGRRLGLKGWGAELAVIDRGRHDGKMLDRADRAMSLLSQ